MQNIIPTVDNKADAYKHTKEAIAKMTKPAVLTHDQKMIVIKKANALLSKKQ